MTSKFQQKSKHMTMKIVLDFYQFLCFDQICVIIIASQTMNAVFELRL